MFPPERIVVGEVASSAQIDRGGDVMSCNTRSRSRWRPTLTERRGGDERRRSQPWFRLDAAFMADDKVVHLGALHGPAGPLVYVALLGAAKLQDEDGVARMGWWQLAHGAFIPSPADVRPIIASAVDAGLVEVLEDTATAFVVQMVGWTEFQRPADPTATERKRRQRARDAADVPPDVTDVTGDKPGQDDCHGTTVDRGQSTPRDERPLQPPGASASPADDVLAEHGLEVSPHPAFEAVMAIVRDVATKRPDVSALVDDAVLRTILAHPQGDHVAAAHTAAADLITGRRTTCHFHKAFGDALRDQQVDRSHPPPGRAPGPEPKPWAEALDGVVAVMEAQG